MNSIYIGQGGRVYYDCQTVGFIAKSNQAGYWRITPECTNAGKPEETEIKGKQNALARLVNLFSQSQTGGTNY